MGTVPASGAAKSLAQFVEHFGEVYRKDLEELMAHDAHRLRVKKLRGEYTELREEAIQYSKRVADNREALREFAALAVKRMLPHLDAAQGVAESLIETSKFVERPSWHRLSETCLHLKKLLGEVMAEAGVDANAATTAAEKDIPAPEKAVPVRSLPERIALQQSSEDERASYLIQRRTMDGFWKQDSSPKESGFLDRFKTAIDKLGPRVDSEDGSYRAVLKAGFVNLESFRLVHDPFTQLVEHLREALTKDPHPVLPEVVLPFREEDGFSGKRRVLYGPLFDNSALFLKVLDSVQRDLPLVTCAEVLFRPGSRLLSELRGTWEWLRTHRNPRPVEVPEYRRWLVTCVESFRDLNQRMASVELES